MILSKKKWVDLVRKSGSWRGLWANKLDRRFCDLQNKQNDAFMRQKMSKADNLMNQKVNLEDLKYELIEKTIGSEVIEKMELLESEIGLPYKQHGVQKIPKERPYYMFERQLIEHQIPHQFITDHLEKIFFGTQHAIVDNDQEFLEEYLEPSFLKKLNQNLNYLKTKGYQLKVVEDVVGNFGEPVKSDHKILDGVFIQGLSTDRSLNDSEGEYHIFKDIQEMGIVTYTSKKLSDPQNFIDPEQNKTMYDDSRIAVTRVLMIFKNPIVLKAFTESGREVKIEEKLNTWQHIGIFECEMIAPPKFKSKFKNEGYMEWMGKWKHSKWRLVDMDNYMMGNPLVVADNKGISYQEEVFRGSSLDPRENIDLRNV